MTGRERGYQSVCVCVKCGGSSWPHRVLSLALLTVALAILCVYVLQISRYWPGVLSSDVELVPDYAGMRPKLQVCPSPPHRSSLPSSPPSPPCDSVCPAVPFGQDRRGLPCGRAVSARPAPREPIRHRVAGPDVMPRPSRPRSAAHNRHATPRAGRTGREWQNIGRRRRTKRQCEKRDIQSQVYREELLRCDLNIR